MASPGTRSTKAGAASSRLRTDDRKAQISAIAAELFSERGYHGVGLGEIASAAGITGPAIYRHFPNKQGILAHAAREFAAALSSCAQEADAAPGSDEEKLRAVVRAVTALVVRRRGSIRLYQWEARHLADGDRAEVARSLRTLISVVAHRLGAVRPELPETTARLQASAALSAVASWSTHRVALSDRAAEETLRSAASVVLAADPPAAPRTPVAPVGPAVSTLAARREKLLAAAVPLFRKQGFHTVSMEEIGTAAGINASSVYRHFSGKADLLAAVYYRAADRLAVATGQALDDAGDAATALRGLVGAYIDFAFGNRDLLAIYLSEYRNLPTDDRHALRRAQRDHIRQWVTLTGQVRPGARHPQVTVQAALNVINDLAMPTTPLAAPEQAAHLALDVLHSA
ncbi:TetR/AcrR family transcriptional regulator [Saccharopolyspora gloriosae]|uniref:TetR/AcrR family transcriptional regulator n=1 Tax=Saccharopolyspora gloriosae TaxID=455344 RepID=UPI001FB7E504|nr:TetR/AcrR family transcriptional regulator [Saccharopolyspora gloriosae]